MSATSDFGKLLKALRKQKKLSQKELAALSGISASYLSRMENSQRNAPHPTVLKKLARPLGLDEYQALCMAGYVQPETGSYPVPKVSSHWHSLIADPSIDKVLNQLGMLTEEEKKGLTLYLQAIKISRESK